MICLKNKNKMLVNLWFVNQVRKGYDIFYTITDGIAELIF